MADVHMRNVEREYNIRYSESGSPDDTAWFNSLSASRQYAIEREMERETVEYMRRTYLSR